MKQQVLQNILVFLERVTVTGKEAYAWAEAHSEVAKELQQASKPKPVEAIEPK